VGWGDNRGDDGKGTLGGRYQPVDVYVEKGIRTMKSKNVLIGGAVAGVIALVCALALVNTLKRSEKRK
jgi:hypothetical protein